MKDVKRTFSDLDLFQESHHSGKNKLFNILKAYSIYDDEIGYMQGMNFLAGLILIIFNQDEAQAWIVYMRVLEINNWKRFYVDDTPKLFEVSKLLREFIRLELPKLNKLMA